MLHFDALGLSGRSGRIHYVGQAAGTCPGWLKFRTLLFDQLTVAIEAQ